MRYSNKQPRDTRSLRPQLSVSFSMPPCGFIGQHFFCVCTFFLLYFWCLSFQDFMARHCMTGTLCSKGFAVAVVLSSHMCSSPVCVCVRREHTLGNTHGGSVFVWQTLKTSTPPSTLSPVDPNGRGWEVIERFSLRTCNCVWVFSAARYSGLACPILRGCVHT
jgi:hypothetical protein